jgi:hypothetical protein
MSDMTLYLTRDEETLLKKTSAPVASWTIEEEKGTAYEKPDEIALRQKMLEDVDHFRQVHSVLSLAKNKHEMIEALRTMRELPQDVFLEMVFALGATFLRGFIESLLTSIHSKDDMESLAIISQLRHSLLEANLESLSK